MNVKPIKEKLKETRFRRISSGLLKGPIKTGWGLAIIAVMILVGFLTCSKKNAEKWSPPQVIKVDTGQALANLHRTIYCEPYRKNQVTGMLAREGDLLLEDNFLFPYRESDGQAFSLKIEDSCRLRLGKKISSLILNEKGWEWLEKASDEDIASLRILCFDDIYFDDIIEESRLPLLKKIAQKNPNIGLSFDYEDSDSRIISLFKPEVLSNIDEESLMKALPYLQNVQFLWVMFTNASILEKLSDLPKLRTLRLNLNKNSPRLVFPPGDKLKHLESLSVIVPESDKIGDISGIGDLKQLKELVLLSEGIDNLEFLAALTELRTLSLNSCENLKDISFLKKLTKLTWLGFPANISQENFNTVLNEHPALQVVELMACKNITDLNALTQLPDLKAVIIGGDTSANIEVLEKIKGLQLLALPKDEFEGGPSENVKKLEKALPGCIIVEGGTACMGSGWILLLFPGVFLALLISRKLRKTLTSGGPAGGQTFEKI